MPTRDIDAGFLERYQSSHDRGIILEALESYSFPESFRKNIRQPGDKNSVFGMCLGLTSWHHLPDRISKHTRGSPRLTELLCAFARWELPSFPFTSIQVNKDYAAALHMDANDVGTSHIIALGDFVGGELWVSNAGRRGREVSINGNWFELDGGLPHCVLPFQGRRYSLVYFNRASCSEGFADQRGSKLAKDLIDLKFPIPMHAIKPIAHPPRKERMDTARNKLRIYMDYIAKRGGAGRVLFHLRDPGGQTLKAAVRPDEPLSRLIEAIAQRKQQPPGAVELRLQRLRLIPGDTILNLGLDPRKYVVDIVISNSRSAEASQALQSASSAQALADAMELTNSMEEAHSVQSSPCTPTSAAPRKLHVLPEVSTPPKHIRGSSEFGADIDRLSPCVGDTNIAPTAALQHCRKVTDDQFAKTRAEPKEVEDTDAMEENMRLVSFPEFVKSEDTFNAFMDLHHHTLALPVDSAEAERYFRISTMEPPTSQPGAAPSSLLPVVVPSAPDADDSDNEPLSGLRSSAMKRLQGWCNTLVKRRRSTAGPHPAAPS